MTPPFEKNFNIADNVVTTAALPAVIPDAVNWEALYQESKAETARVNSLLTASRLSRPTAAPNADKRPSVSAEHVRRSLSPVAFLNLTRDDKLRTLNVDPASIKDSALLNLFGRGTDGTLAGDLFKTDQLKYRQLKECAKILNLYGA